MNVLGVRLTGECPKCGDNIIVQRNRTTGDPFLACAGYPRCRWTGKYDEALDEIAERILELRDENSRLRDRAPAGGIDLSRELRNVIKLAHPDKWGKGSAVDLATEITKALTALREKLK